MPKTREQVAPAPPLTAAENLEWARHYLNKANTWGTIGRDDPVVFELRLAVSHLLNAVERLQGGGS